MAAAAVGDRQQVFEQGTAGGNSGAQLAAAHELEAGAEVRQGAGHPVALLAFAHHLFAQFDQVVAAGQRQQGDSARPQNPVELRRLQARR